MVRQAIHLADRDWCESASSGWVRVYDFKEPRKMGIRSLGKGSVCVILTKGREGQRVFYGEFTATEVKEVEASEYDRLVRQGLIHNPLVLKPSEK